MNLESTWPKILPVLSAEQEQAKEKYMMMWHQLLPSKYSAVEKFNHGFISKLPIPSGIKTLEVGAGLGAHADYENLKIQDYHFLEYREEFCEALRKKYPTHKVNCGNIQEKQEWPAKSFDRVIAVHVLEHLPDLPKALTEIDRLLKEDGFFDVVLPCEAGMAHSLGRKLTAERFFVKNFKMDFAPICKSEHVNTYVEIMKLLRSRYKIESKKYFPFYVPWYSLNFCAAFRLIKK